MGVRKRAIRIGRVEAFISVSIGVLVAQLIMTAFMTLDDGLPDAFLWFAKVGYRLNLVIAVLMLYFSAYLFGGMAGVCIIIKKWNYLGTGVLFGMLILVTATFLGSLTGFFQEGLDNLGTGDSPFYDYLFKPFFWVSVFGFLPVVLVGCWFGSRIRRKGRLLHN